MREAERLDVRRIRVQLKARNIEVALRLLDSLLDSVRPRVPPYDYPRLPGLDSVFFCVRLHGWMSIEDCLVRRSRVWPSGGGKGTPQPCAAVCVGCVQGQEHERTHPTFVPPPSTIASELLDPSQRMAKRARALVGLDADEAVSLDPLKSASGMSPDDPNDWRG